MCMPISIRLATFGKRQVIPRTWKVPILTAFARCNIVANHDLAKLAGVPVVRLIVIRCSTELHCRETGRANSPNLPSHPIIFFHGTSLAGDAPRT